MRIALLGNAASIHTVKWADGLASRGHDVHLISQDEPAEHRINDAVTQHRLPHSGTLGYFRNPRALRTLDAMIQPDVINAHYASGYGTTLRLARLARPSVLNVWGSDVYDFPHRSPIHKLLIISNLKRPTRVASTSHCMAAEIVPLVRGREIDITPFGVDPAVFTPATAEATPTGVIGTIKKLDPKYGIDTLIQAFAQLRQQARLVIAGTGPQEASLKQLAAELGVADRVEFLGAVANSEVPGLLRGLDVYAALSRLDSESFGVAIIEAAACGVPTVVSDAAGPAEVVDDGVTGIIVPRDNPSAAAEALDRLLADPQAAHAMGQAGRRHVIKHYSWEYCLNVMEDVYGKAIADFGAGRQRPTPPIRRPRQPRSGEGSCASP